MTKKWDNDQSLEELLFTYRSNFLITHGYSPVYMPSPITKDWVVDQLKAIDWYLKYDFSPNKQKEAPMKVPKKRKIAVNPFK